MKNVIREFNVHSGVTAAFIESTLTEDISTVESIYDLLDNSIDAARTSILEKNKTNDLYGLPADYSGYKITIRIDKNSIRILDNCSGIDEDTIKDGMFVVAKRSAHIYGIGHYGIGLKRSLLKLGNKYSMLSDNSKYSFKMSFENNQIGNETDSLIAKEITSTKKNKALFSISDLKSEIRYDISNEIWFDNLISGISDRYANFIKKGLKIKVVNATKGLTKNIKGITPSIRENALVMPFKQQLKMGDVDVYIESGIHEEYLFPGEHGHSISKNRELTEQFGLYFTCNDRIIVSANTSKEYGWGDAKWHSEYNGFICWIKFVSRYPGKLPWNTAKTGLRLDSTMFLQVKDIIEPITKKYRKEIKERYLKKKTQTNSGSGSAQQESDSNKPKDNNNKTNVDGQKSSSQKKEQKNKTNSTTKNENNKIDHPENWKTLLPEHFPFSGDDILDAFIKEAKYIIISNASHAAAMLYRAIMEASALYFVRKNNKVSEVKELYFQTEGKRKNLSDEQKEVMDISLDMMIKWFKANSNNLVSSNERKILNTSLRHLDNHKSYINGVVHCHQIITSEKLIPIRNDTYKFLEFLVKNRMN
ncbi:Uncharacterised protein [Klebsiella quasipneumoniae]|uniref:ATP-binding protein n=1 Tax=Klebsiella quasipneumoniae TaxID=1463165 RepID=UPI0009B9909D|nr:ATP-binding protein [Klebsiella quasipneumoniae]MCD7076334.1 ATP-binding protein [Klebsiella quasipneumoniae subsp. similipneumoniae]MCD7106597.1 ATP-binding protein [Klebsiella quasipneumoniae subsp. similipneumoniae]SLV92895.1 Uncharacterised protein [Klebsiella quasipneumoniae]SLW57470.1 Uncharacterised protein [Klebsiella quasipneumoniae]SMA43061.1 Uncharacterised protein [Klebsiella quasipneumoniae]